jgi:aryl sulfotransferase
MTSQLPEVLHVYQNHSFDSTRWRLYQPRDDDVIIATSYKSGTTWMQYIVHQLIFLGQAEAPSLWDVAFWLDSRYNPELEEVIATLEAQQHRRSIKTHLALDGLPFFPQVKYIVVARDACDVFMSWWNHYSNYTDGFYTYINSLPGRVGPSLPRCPEDIHDYWRQWIARGRFEWEVEGYPQWGNMHHTQTWWNYRHLDNILFVHFNDLLADLEGEIGRVAAFLDISITADQLSTVAQAVSFAAIKQQATADPEAGTDTWKGGMATFFHKGVNGRWRNVLSEEEVAMYEETAVKVLTPECKLWLEQGRRAFD